MGNTGVRHPKETKERARAMRAAGESVRGIARAMLLPQSTISEWVRHIPVPDDAREELRTRALRGTERHRELTLERHRVWESEARLLWAEWSKEPFFLLGIGLYWGEGSKSARSKKLSFSNSDPAIIRTWAKWCQKYIPQISLKGTVFLHDLSNAEQARLFWQGIVSLDEAPLVIAAVSSASQHKRPKNSLPHGTFRLTARKGSTEWWVKMKVWMELAQTLQPPVV